MRPGSIGTGGHEASAMTPVRPKFLPPCSDPRIWEGGGFGEVMRCDALGCDAMVLIRKGWHKEKITRARTTLRLKTENEATSRGTRRRLEWT